MKKMKVNNTVKGVCALAMGCAAMVLELASVVISIPAQAAGWGAHKLIDAATKLTETEKEQTAHKDNGDEIIDVIKNIDAE